MYLRLATWLVVLAVSAPAWAQASSDASAVFVMKSDGSGVRKVAEVDGYVDHAAPRWSHDGKRLVFDARQQDGPERSCFVVDTDGTGLREVGKGRLADWSPDDRQIAFHVDGSDGAAEIYVQNLDGQGRVKIADGRSPRWSLDGSVLVYSDRTMLRAVDLLDGASKALLPEPVALFDGFGWSPDGKAMAVVVRPVADGPRHLLFVDPAGENQELVPRLINKMGGFVSYSPDGERLVFSNAWQIHIVDVAGDAEPRKIAGQVGKNRHPAFSPDGEWIAFIGSRQTPRPAPATKAAMPTAKILEELRRHDKRTIVYSLDFTPDGRKVVMGGDPINTGVEVWDLTTGETRDLGGRGIHVNMFPDGRRFATSWLFPVAQVIDVESGEVLREFDHGGRIWALSLSPDGRRLLTGGTDKVVRIWNVETGEQILALDPHADWVSRAAFSPSGKEVITISHDKTLRVWDAETGKRRLAIQHPAALWGLAFTPDARHVLTGTGGDLRSSLTVLDIGPGPDNVVRMWDLETGKRVREMKGHTGAVITIDVSPDGRLAASGGADGTMRLWNLATGDELSKIGPGKGAVAYVGFSPDGELIVAGGGVNRLEGRLIEFPRERIRVYKVLDTNVPAAAKK